MKCEEALDLLNALAEGTWTGPQARAVRLHVAGCSKCSARLNASQWMEILPALDETVEPSERFAVEFRKKLRARTAKAPDGFRAWAWPKRAAAAGAIGALIVTGILGIRFYESGRENRGGTADSRMTEDLSLLKDMPIISNMDFLEDFDAIENLQPSAEEESGKRTR